jgi:hypothetical protein
MVGDLVATAKVAKVATVGGLKGSCVAKVAGIAVASPRKPPLLIRSAKFMPATPGESG